MKKILIALAILFTCSGLYAEPVPKNCVFKTQEEVIWKLEGMEGCYAGCYVVSDFLENLCNHWKANKKIMLAAIKNDGMSLKYASKN